ncbi:mannosyl-oligosaccharide 1,3-1,6-alpha-mannosidase activity protein [Coemansia sp. IMI 209128]|nr:mannosyl-oligosaccharide 1,3-1,6-alpha-mannosidase activity protein [Coemansia sp. IMI 209128]
MLPRRYIRGGGLVLAAVAAAVVISGNRAAFPFGKPAWMPRFSGPSPSSDRDLSLAPMPSSLTLHLVPHSHSDVGWNLSFDGYYHRSVHQVMRRVVAELWQDSRRRFTWGDLAFIDMWFSDEGDKPHGGMLRGAPETLTWRQAVQRLVAEGRWEIVSGTYVSPDEGLTTWWAHNAIVDVGHRLLARELNTTSSDIGWQIDNFGHINTMPYLLSNTGYSSMVLGRMAYRQLRDFADRSSLQFMWQRDSLTPALLTHFLSVHYAAPSPSFDFDNTERCNPAELLEELKRFAQSQARQYPSHGHILVMMGDDFRYIHAQRGFSCLDQIIDMSEVRSADSGVSVRYSTPGEYFAAIRPHLDTASLRLHQDDFYPYQDKPYEQYWSGVLATRADLKWLIRDTEQIVQHVEALLAVMRIKDNTSKVSRNWEPLEQQLEECRKQVAIGYHHDAITGTCAAVAAADYKLRLRRAARQALGVGRAALLLLHEPLAEAKGDAYNTAAQYELGEDADNLAREYVVALGNNSSIAVTNAAALVPQDAVVRVQLGSLDSEIVDSATSQVVPADVVGSVGKQPVVEFLARSVPGLGLRSYSVRSGGRVKDKAATQVATAQLRKSDTHVDLRIVGGRIRVSIGTKAVVWHSLRQYFANPLVQSSGAYVMHSFMLMYMVVFIVFGCALVLGLGVSVVVHFSGVAWVRHVLVPQLSRGKPAWWSSPASVTAGSLSGMAFTYYVAQIADIEMLTAWTVGNGLVGLRLAAPVFLSAYAVAGALRWPARRCVLYVYSVAAGVVLTLFWAPTWQSRPIAPVNRLFTTRSGSVCDTAQIHLGTALVTYRLCADQPGLLQVTTTAAPARDREVVAQYELDQPGWAGASCSFDIYNGVDLVRRQYSRWTPVPGNYYPAVSHVSLANRPLALHLRQATGATCIRKNTLEVMVRRDMSANDYRGLIAPIHDVVPVAVTHFIDVSGGPNVLATNNLVNTPPLAFALPVKGPDTLSLMRSPLKNARLVGIQVADSSVHTPAAGGDSGALSVLARVQVLPGSQALNIQPGNLISPAKKAFAVDGGDWTMAPLSTRNRTERHVDRLQVSAGQQTLFRLSLF